MDKNDQSKGLTTKEAIRQLAKQGYNELPSQKKQNVLSILISVIREPMLLLLICSGVLYLFMGDTKDAIMLSSCVVIVIGITVYQERKTEKTLDALRTLSSPRALVRRDGKQLRIFGREVVVDDVIILREGDRVPADIVILSCENLSVDESLLSGESIPVRKSIWDGKKEKQRPGGDDLPFVFSGTLIVSGHGIGKVYAIGQDTQMGKIGKSLVSIKDEDTLLKKETGRIVRVIAGIGIFLCGCVVLLYTLIKGDLLGGILAGLTLSMSMVPEEFPVVLVIFLTLGAWRISKRKVLTRKSTAIETLGAATVLCTDKTGTLTLNRMELTSLYSDNSYYEVSDFASTTLPEQFRQLLECGVLASQQDPFDPIERELHKKETLYVKEAAASRNQWKLIKEYPLSKDLFAVTHVWNLPNSSEFTVVSKGAPEAILEMCHVSAKEKQQLLQEVRDMSKKGLRVLGVGKTTYAKTELPQSQQEFNLTFVGFVGFIDPLRSTATQAIKESYAAGIRVIMVTGDFPGTAQFIGKSIGLKNPELMITGEELSHMDHHTLRERIKTTNIFARIMPEQKLLIVNALKANNEIVAMTGDGVNDAPALKAAHIGIAMGEKGTDVAREASALVLLNDDFSSIVAAVRLGRRIFNNLQRAMGYIVAVHVPIAGMTLLPLLFNLPPILLPAHIAFLELIIDPACSTVFESEQEDADIMEIPPRNLHTPLFNRSIVVVNVLQGLGVLIVCFILYWFLIQSGKGEVEARTIAFTSLILANLLLIVTNLSWKQTVIQTFKYPNKALTIVLVAALFCLGIIVYIPFFADLFYVTALHPEDFLFIGMVVVVSLFWFEGLEIIHKAKPTFFYHS